MARLVRVDVPRRSVAGDRAAQRRGRDGSLRAGCPTGRALEGLVEGFDVGDNELVAQTNGRGRGRPDPARLEIVNHPIEGQIFSGPHQQPFVCTTAWANFDGRKLLDQPVVDNQDRFGIPVAEDAAGNSIRTIAATDARCADRGLEQELRCVDPGRLRTGRPTGSSIGSTPSPGAAARRGDDHDDGRSDRAVRGAPGRGTIDRFIYTVAMLAPVTETDPLRPDDSLWNRRLVFNLQGGVAIGRTQGTVSGGAMLRDDV